MSDQSPVIFAGTPHLAAAALQQLIDAKINIVAVLTRQDAPFGRKRILTPSPVAQVAEQQGIPVIKANQVDEQTDHRIRETGAQLGVVIAYGALLKQRSLDLLKHGWINLHYSLLPKYRGAAPVQRALMDAVETTGVSIFKLTAGLDTGPIIAQKRIEVPEGINAGKFLDQLTELGSRMLPGTIHAIFDGTAQYAEQVGESSYAAKLTKEDALIDFFQPHLRVAGHINGTSPSPGAWAFFHTKVVKFSEATPANTHSHLEPGEFEATPQGIVVGALDGAVRISQVQPAGKRMMNAADWSRGITENKIFSTKHEES